MKVIISWSGGKDSSFAYYKALKANFSVVSLVTFMHTADKSNFHGIKADILDEQAKSIGIQIHKSVTEPESYEKYFKETLLHFKASGVQGLVTGDISEVPIHEEGWIERVCTEVGLKPIRPLWQTNTTQIFKDYIKAGFKATVVRTKLDALGEEWLGRQLDQSFLNDILQLHGVDPCGEGGEYHTIVTDGPIFKNQINIVKTTKSTQNGYGHLEIDQYTIDPKNNGEKPTNHL
jgi:diphthine-ammonia ligase